MPLVLTQAGVLAVVNAALRGVPIGVRYGLFQNDWHPARDSVIGQVQPCDFSGYTGLVSVGLWLAPTLQGNAAVSVSTARTWVRGSGPVSNWVNGYYALDADGVLIWGERSTSPPAAMVEPGNLYEVIPQFSVSSRF